MNTVSNQRTIKVNKEICDKEHLYTTTNIEVLNKALFELDGYEFKLWAYLSKNQKGYEFAFSSKDFTHSANMSRPTYTKSFNGLVEKGYLVETSPNHYDFYEKPKDEDEIKFITNVGW